MVWLTGMASEDSSPVGEDPVDALWSHSHQEEREEG
jgi:hypothetical protein